MSGDAKTAVDEATTETKPEETPKKKRKRTVYLWGRSGVALTPYTVPDGGIPTETIPEDWELFRHKVLNHEEDFQDPMDYYRWLQDVFIPQLAKVAEKQISAMQDLGDANVRKDVLAVGGKVAETGEVLKAKIKANKGNAQALAAINKEMAEMMAELKAAMDS